MQKFIPDFAALGNIDWSKPQLDTKNKQWTIMAIAAVAMLKVDNNTIKIKDEKAYVAKVSTDVLEQGERNLILCAGSSNI